MSTRRLSEAGFVGRRSVVVILTLLVVSVVSVGVGAAWVGRKVDPPGKTGGEVAVEIRHGTSTAGIADLLEERGVVSDGRVFRLYLQAKGGGSYQAGRYIFRRNDSMARVKRILERGATIESSRLSIPEGLTLDQIAERVGRLPGRSAARALEVARSGTVRSQFTPAGFTNLEGLLYPDTYMVTDKEDEARILTRMVEAFDQVAGGLGYQDARSRVGITPYQAVVVASMIEREAKVDEDRGPIARVIYNRLQQRMPLQIDATVAYSLGRHKERILNRDLEVNSPYNTYKIPGLPPGPIASPGREALAAAINPPPGPWIYYVLAEANGKHAFATTSAEFERYKAAAKAKGLL